MGDDDAARIAEDPHYRRLIAERGRFTWLLTGVMLVAYFGFVLLVAFDKALLARSIAGGVTSIGIVLGFAIILLAIALTGLYVRAANRRFDPLVERIVADHREPRA